MKVSRKIAQVDLKYSCYAPQMLLILRNKITADEMEPHVAGGADGGISKKLLIQALQTKNELF